VPIRRIIALVALLLIGGIGGIVVWLCVRVPHEAPPRATDRIVVPPQRSVIAVPISAPISGLRVALETAVPHALWTTDRPGQVCVPPSRVKVLFAHLKTPTIKCRIVAQVTRGALALSGSGQTIQISMPLHAVVSAQDIGGILKRETATADAHVRVIVRLDLASDWSPRGKISISYDWTDAPHVDFLGRRIEFTSKADARLKHVIAKLEQTLPRELQKLSVRDHVAEAWRAAFTSLNLNRADPPVWLRITPRDLSYGGYSVVGDRLALRLGMTAVTETFVGPQPPDPPSTPLPPLRRLDEPAGIVRFAVPVIADYHELEPVLMRALVKRSARPFDVPGLGPIRAQFGSVTMYGTTGGRIAVGITFSAARPGERSSHGTVWLTALPLSQPNSRRVAFANLSVTGVTDSTGSSLLLKLANAPVLVDTLADALTQNFARDYDRLLSKIGTALAEKRVEHVLLRAHIDDVRTGALKATGEGVYLPVAGKGNAAITLIVPDK
jgi:hypothetical protein